MNFSRLPEAVYSVVSLITYVKHNEEKQCVSPREFRPDEISLCKYLTSFLEESLRVDTPHHHLVDLVRKIKKY